ncbi:hypothetical protein [Polyangium sp. 6x1]|uniref:hypothetical protein n=1 Tax=Polyangium sp. 6x1 TaxID=3042689 RepID=UPI00248329FC|nr:hypothetical protein [Polyangium sp. 6x1]MDI1442549.1 hypothetical protein [Polyangium sp. 6x1]
MPSSKERGRRPLRVRSAPSSLALAALLAACARRDASVDPPPEASAGVAASATPAAPSIERPPARPLDRRVVASLEEASVNDASYARRMLWSWTSREQAATLRRDKQLLLDTTLPEGPTTYVQLLEQVAAGGGPNGDMARLLLFHPSLRLRRYAWTRPWPTRLGLAERDYGDQLLRVVLSPRAIVARFDPARPAPFEFRDLDGRAISIGQVLADPSVVAAVYHVHAENESPVAYREYVLCNETMVTEWSLATPEITDAISADRALAQALAGAHLEPGSARPHWTSGGGDGAALYASALAFDNERYRSTANNLRTLADALARAEQVGAPLVVVPSVKFAYDAQVPDVRMRKLPKRVRIMV